MGTRRANGTGTLFKRNGWYYYRSIGEDGKVFCRSCKTKDKEAAEIAIADFRVGDDLPRQARLTAVVEYLKQDGSNPSLEEAYQKYTSHPKNAAQSEGARKEDLAVWKTFNRWLYGQSIAGRRTNCKAAHSEVRKIDDITNDIASEFIGSYQCSPQTKNKFVRILKRIWSFNSSTNNPWSNFSKFKAEHHKRRSLSDEEVEKVISSANGEMKILFLFGAYTGLRMTDCATIRWDNLTDDYTTLTVKPIKTKNSSGVIVTIPVHDKLSSELRKLNRTKDGFITPVIASMPKWKLSDTVQDHLSKCGLVKSEEHSGYRNATPTVGFHSLRSTYISNMANAGAPLAMVQAIVGHMSPELTQLYYRSEVERARVFVNRL